MSAAERLVYPRSARHLAFVIGSGLALVAGAAFLLTRVGPRSLDPADNDLGLEVVRAVAVVALAFFGLCLGVVLPELWSREPVLELDAEGLIDRTTGVAVGRVPWSEVVRVQPKGEWVEIEVRDLDALTRDLSPLRRWGARLNGKTVHVLSGPAGVTADALAETIRERWERSRAS